MERAVQLFSQAVINGNLFFQQLKRWQNPPLTRLIKRGVTERIYTFTTVTMVAFNNCIFVI